MPPAKAKQQPRKIATEAHPYIMALREASHRRDFYFAEYNLGVEAVRELMVGAQAAGASITEIARSAKMSRTRVYEVLEAAKNGGTGSDENQTPTTTSP